MISCTVNDLLKLGKCIPALRKWPQAAPIEDRLVIQRFVRGVLPEIQTAGEAHDDLVKKYGKPTEKPGEVAVPKQDMPAFTAELRQLGTKKLDEVQVMRIPLAVWKQDHCPLSAGEIDDLLGVFLEEVST